MKELVIDASVAVKWLSPEPDYDIADAISKSGIRLIAPRFVFAEVANALTRKVRNGLMRISDVTDAIGKLHRYFDRIVDERDLLPDALASAAAHNHPIYDFIYLQLAVARNATMVSADRKLALKLQGTPLRDRLVVLEDWHASPLATAPR